MSGTARRRTAALAAILAAEAMGATLLVGAAAWRGASRRFVDRAWPVQGVVTASEGSDARRDDRPHILFETPRGEAHRLPARGFTPWPEYQVGDRVTVLYDPDDPSNARVDGYQQLWLGPTALAALGFLFVALPPLAYAWPIRRPKPPI